MWDIRFKEHILFNNNMTSIRLIGVTGAYVYNVYIKVHIVVCVYKVTTISKTATLSLMP